MKLISFLRIKYFEKEDNIEELKKFVSQHGSKVPPISIENERKAMGYLKLLCMKALKKYPNTLT